MKYTIINFSILALCCYILIGCGKERTCICKDSLGNVLDKTHTYKIKPRAEKYCKQREEGYNSSWGASCVLQ